MQIYEQSAFVAITGYFLLAAGHWLIGIFTSDLPVYNTPPAPDEAENEFSHRATVFKLRHYESVLRKVRRTKKRYGWQTKTGTWQSEVAADWQLKAMLLTDDAFELFLIKEVWASKGKRYERMRAKNSPLKNKTFPVFHPVNADAYVD